MIFIYQLVYTLFFNFIIISYTIVSYFPISYPRPLTLHTPFTRKHTDIHIS
jgi:hypothetical protein